MSNQTKGDFSVEQTLSAGFAFRPAQYAASTVYAVGDYVEDGDTLYKVKIASTTVDIATDLGAGRIIAVTGAGGATSPLHFVTLIAPTVKSSVVTSNWMQFDGWTTNFASAGNDIILNGSNYLLLPGNRRFRVSAMVRATADLGVTFWDTLGNVNIGGAVRTGGGAMQGGSFEIIVDTPVAGIPITLRGDVAWTLVSGSTAAATMITVQELPTTG